MKICIFENAQEAAVAGANIIAEVIKAQEKTVLGLATGSTPVPMYKELINKNASGELDFTNVYSYNLDEYIGLDGTHDQSYRYFMNDNLFDHININKANTHVPCGTGEDHAADAAAYDAAIEAEGGIDVQVLGIGNNGHIGFNEPETQLGSRTHVVLLSDSTREANARFFNSLDEVPKYAATMGIRTVMNARSIILMAIGKAKAEIMMHTVLGPVTEEVPASVLQLHPDCTVYCDEEAAAYLC